MSLAGVRKQYLSTRHCVCLLLVLLKHMLNTRVWLWLPALLINVVTFAIHLSCKTVIWNFSLLKKNIQNVHSSRLVCAIIQKIKLRISKSRSSIPCRPSFTIKSTRLEFKFLSPKASAQIPFTAKATPYPATSWSLQGSKENVKYKNSHESWKQNLEQSTSNSHLRINSASDLLFILTSQLRHSTAF